MIRACHVNEVGGPRLHVTVDAAVTQALLPSIGVRQATTIFLMTSEASLSIVSSFLFLGWRLMRIVARDAPQSASAVAKTAAGVHLFHFAGEFFLLIQRRRFDENRPEVAHWQAGPIVRQLPSSPYNSYDALQMALLTDCFPQSGRQPARVNDGLLFHGDVPVLLVPFDVKLTGAMTTLAADSLAGK